MKNLVINISKAFMNGIYRVLRLGAKRRDEVVFLSRQAIEPSYDFRQFAKQFEDAGWTATMHMNKVRSRDATGSEGGIGTLAYAAHVLRELRLLARCRVVVLDRFDPVVSFLNFECDAVKATPGVLHSQFPTAPIVVQVWHAFGAFKKFGYQTVGGREGHPAATMESFQIHRNYTWILCSSEAARAPFAEAFSYPIERLIAFTRPEYYLLCESVEGAIEDEGGSKSVLVAPTVRMNEDSPRPLHDLYGAREVFEQQAGARVLWSYHPLEIGQAAPNGLNNQLLAADVVVTDYSSIVYDAYLLGKPVVFYMPDHDEYAQTPGLNSDPLSICPELCATTQQDLVSLVRKALEDSQSALASLGQFARPAFDGARQQPDSLPEFLGLTATN